MQQKSVSMPILWVQGLDYSSHR